ncbi:MAG: bifunctional nicotinamidase/pyrazinamidase [Candidatus Omnitrophica bacterium]|nr:bifunctional nicotinamidase/pyrazinamidase [Candidatus Omnitrophota bacterium]
MPGKALLIIDVQNDFSPGGSLAVPEADKIIPYLNQYIKLFKKKKYPIFASRDWHPRKSRHFKDFGGGWPIHCVQRTKGARFHPQLKLPKKTIVLSKGMFSQEDSYSAMEAKNKKGETLKELLKKLNIQELYVGGLATDYCVKMTVLDLLKEDFKVNLLLDAIKGVNLKPNDSEKAIKLMQNKGAILMNLEEVKEIL